MYDQIRTKANLGYGSTPTDILFSRQNVQDGYIAGRKVPKRMMDDELVTGINYPFIPLRDKTQIIRDAHKKFADKLLMQSYNRVTINGVPTMIRQQASELPQIEKTKLFSTGTQNQGQMNNVVEYLDKKGPYANTIYATDKARNLAKSLIGSVGLMPQKKIDETFENLNAKLDGLHGQVMQVKDNVADLLFANEFKQFDIQSEQQDDQAEEY